MRLTVSIFGNLLIQDCDLLSQLFLLVVQLLGLRNVTDELLPYIEFLLLDMVCRGIAWAVPRHLVFGSGFLFPVPPFRPSLKMLGDIAASCRPVQGRSLSRRQNPRSRARRDRDHKQEIRWSMRFIPLCIWKAWILSF